MPAPEVTREELKRVEDRVEFVAREVDGEKLLSRYILRQSRQSGDGLAALKTRMERVEEKVDRLDTDLRGLRNDFNSSQAKLPGIIAEVMRQVLREKRAEATQFEVAGSLRHRPAFKASSLNAPEPGQADAGLGIAWK